MAQRNCSRDDYGDGGGGGGGGGGDVIWAFAAIRYKV